MKLLDHHQHHHHPALHEPASGSLGRSPRCRTEIGYNHEISYGGRVFHVQTEDSGRDKGHVDTHVFHAGAIVASSRVDYESMMLDSEILGVMKGSHKSMLRKLVRGLLDRAIARRLGSEASPAEPGPRGALPAAVPDDPPPPASNSETTSVEPETDLETSLDMDNVKQVLEQLLGDVSGSLAAAVVDYESGMCLGTAGGGIDIDVAAAGNMEVMKAKTRVMKDLGIEGGIEDILITLESQYHIIRPINDSVFMYLAFDRNKGNLAMARRKLAAAGGSIKV